MNHSIFNEAAWRRVLPVFWLVSSVMLCACSKSASSVNEGRGMYDGLEAELRQIADEAPGQVGVAVITPEGLSIEINNEPHYQLMSVFKLHEALAVAHVLDVRGVSLDTVISFSRSEMNPDTWSPMLDEHKEAQLNIAVSELLRYIIQLSDNNASNLLFDRIVSTEDCDSFVRAAVGIEDFSIKYTERQMHGNHSLADGNHSSPLACARLLEQVFTDSIVSSEKQAAIQEMLLGCHTGDDRINAPLKGRRNVTLAHKTGSGFRSDRGVLMAHNDIGRVTLPDGRAYVLAVMIKDFNGTEAEASAVIAKISEAVFNAFSQSAFGFNRQKTSRATPSAR